MEIQILVVKKINLLTEGICSCLEADKNFKLLGITEDFQSTLRFCQQNQPQVIILCLELQSTGMAGFVRQILSLYPEVKIIGLSRNADRHSVIEMLSAGLMAYITSTDSNYEELSRAIHSVIDRRVYLCQEISIFVADDIRNNHSKDFASSMRLGDREEQVLKFIADGFSSKEIAQELHISPSTVEVHRRNIMRKIGLHKVADLTRYAIRNQISSI